MKPRPIPSGVRAAASASIDPAVAAGWMAAIDRSQFVLELEADGSIVRANAVLCRALGYAQAELVGRRHREFIVPGACANVSAGEPHRTIVYRARDGREIVVRATVTPIVSDSADPPRALVIGVDVSARNELRAVLSAGAVSAGGARAESRASSGRESRLSGLAELLMHDRLEPSRHRHARTVFDSGHTMLGLLDDLIVASQIDDSFGGGARTAIDIGAKVRECAEQLRTSAEAKGLVLRCEVDPDLPATVECDALRLRQAVVNLIGNAIKFTQSGWVSVCTEPAWDDPDTLAISVADTGIGMSAEEVRAAMGGEGTGGASFARDSVAAGLGLTISAELARLMGGSLALSSERGRGTRAELRLPLRPHSSPYGGHRPHDRV